MKDNYIKNGNIKVKVPKKNIIGTIIAIWIFIILILMVVAISLEEGVGATLPGIAGSLGFIYLILISPSMQRSKNYEIYTEDGSLRTFKLYYKGNEVHIDCIINENGKFSWKDETNKHNCVYYANEKSMSNITKYKIVNYFNLWLETNDLLSKPTKLSLE